jgi:hypothetical protein
MHTLRPSFTLALTRTHLQRTVLITPFDVSLTKFQPNVSICPSVHDTTRLVAQALVMLSSNGRFRPHAG